MPWYSSYGSDFNYDFQVMSGFQIAHTLQPPHSEAWITGAKFFSRFRLPAELS